MDTLSIGQVAGIEAKLRDLQRMRDTLLRLIGACGGTGSLHDCRILEAVHEGPS